MRPLLKDGALWAELQEKGVVRIPFLRAEELEQLRDFYQNAHPNGTLPKLYDNIHMTTWYKDKVYKYAVKMALEKIMTPGYGRYFKDYRSLNQVFIVKMPGRETNFNIHQDWNVVDEEKYPSVNVWIPLDDVDESNGAMWIIHGSHRIQTPIRGAGALFPNYMEMIDELKPHMTSYPMKAGEALVFFHNTIHGSPPNQGVKPRVVAASSVVHEDTPLRIYYHPPHSGRINLYEPPDDFVFRYDRLREDSEVMPPAGEEAGTLPLSQFRQPRVGEVLEVMEVDFKS